MMIEDGLWTVPGERTGGRGEEPRYRLVPEQGRRNSYLKITPTDHFLESLVAVFTIEFVAVRVLKIFPGRDV